MAVALQQRLLRMMASGVTASDDVAQLSSGEWAQLLLMARRHRLGPLLHWRLNQSGGSAHVPKAFGDAVASSFQKHERRAADLQAEISRVQRILREGEIPAVFLTGAFLAFHAYPLPALRPLRDLDVLVPESQRSDAEHALKGSALRRVGSIETRRRHIAVALHSRLTEANDWRTARRSDPAFNAGTWNRLICSVVGEEEVWYLSPEDQLLHLVIHALYDNPRYCCPLVLTDIAQLIAHSSIDWPLFWQMATAGRWVDGCWLLLNLTQHYFPQLTFSPPEDLVTPNLPADLGAIAATLTLGSLQERTDASRRLNLQMSRGPLSFVLQLLGQGRRLAGVH